MIQVFSVQQFVVVILLRFLLSIFLQSCKTLILRFLNTNYQYFCELILHSKSIRERLFFTKYYYGNIAQFLSSVSASFLFKHLKIVKIIVAYNMEKIICKTNILKYLNTNYPVPLGINFTI